MNVKEAAGEAKGWISYVAGWVFWIGAVGLAIIFTGAILRQWGVTIPMIPRMDWLPMLYAAGVVWALSGKL